MKNNSRRTITNTGSNQMITANPTQYIFPPRTKVCFPRQEASFLKGDNWIAQYKYNDSRCLLKKCPDGTIQLWNRHAERFRTYTAPPELLSQAKEIFQKLNCEDWGLLDGGLLDQKHPAIKDKIVIWDILVLNGTHQLGTTYSERYSKILNVSNKETQTYTDKHGKTYNLGNNITKDIFIPQNNPQNNWENMWTTIDEINKPFSNNPLIEGLVYKNLSGILQLGYKVDNNTDWSYKSRVKTARHNF